MKSRLFKAYHLLFEHFGPQHWWPGDTPWEICTGAVLTQNTSWKNVEKAVAALKSHNCLDPECILRLPDTELEELIKPSGFFRVKTVRLKNVAAWWRENVKNNRLAVRTGAMSRQSLLAVCGVGPETADSILLYAFNYPVFVIDAYTRRIASRHFAASSGADYHDLQKMFMENLPADSLLYNEYHALLVRLAKEYCVKAECRGGCPLRRL